jgi:hypothetical protein
MAIFRLFFSFFQSNVGEQCGARGEQCGLQGEQCGARGEQCGVVRFLLHQAVNNYDNYL